MIRLLYRCLVWLHPPVFRREFSDELLWIYDEAAQREGAATLIFDGLVSLMRQWLIRSGCWKLLAAVAGAMFQVSIGAALMRGIARSRLHSTLATVADPELAAMMRLGAVTAVVLLLAVILLVFSWRKLARRTEV